MKAYEDIKKLFDIFITSLEDKNKEEFLSLFHCSFTAQFSNIGFFEDADSLYEHLIFDNKINFQKNDICNFVVRSENDRAVMSSYVMSLIGIDDGRTFYPFQYGGKYVLKFKNEGSWKIEQILYDLDWYKGNSSFVEGWKLIDYKAFAGHTPMIVSELDSPWVQIQSKQDYPDEYLIKETLFRYSFGLDNCDFSLHKSSYIDEIKFYNNGKLVYKNAYDILKDFKRLNHKEHTLQHAIKVCHIDIDHDHAKLEGLRIEPHRIGSKSINHETKENSYFSAKYCCYFLKEKGMWKMYEIHYDPKVMVKKEERLNHYVDDMKEIFINV